MFDKDDDDDEEEYEVLYAHADIDEPLVTDPGPCNVLYRSLRVAAARSHPSMTLRILIHRHASCATDEAPEGFVCVPVYHIDYTITTFPILGFTTTGTIH